VAKERLTNIDTLMPRVEDDISPNHRTGVMVMAAPLDFERLKRTVVARLMCFPRFRQRVVEPVLPRRPPTWQDDPNFDLHHHLQTASLRLCLIAHDPIHVPTYDPLLHYS
jgi:diacylglycerol O-acyltransferase